MNKRRREHQIEELIAGVDWVSATMQKGDAYAQHFYVEGQSAILAIRREGHEYQERSLLGFRGAMSGGCFCGENDTRYYLQLAGEYADRYYPYIDWKMPHYSRIDVQVTVKYVDEQLDIAKDVYDGFISGNKDISSGRKRKGYLIVGSDGGDTVYLGAPSSSQRARVYNKAKQSEREAYERCWRFEVVFRDEMARQWAELHRCTSGEKREHILETVARWLEVRGVNVPYSYRGDLEVLPKQRTLPTDVERKLNWLKTQVAPTVAYLLELGFRDTILAHLGIVPDDE